MPAKYIYEPWLAPLEVQKKAGCIIGKVNTHSLESVLQPLYSLTLKWVKAVLPFPCIAFYN